MLGTKRYLDVCCFNRPYDDQRHLSVFLETQAKLAIQELISESKLQLIWSFILDFENASNPDEVIKQEIATWREKAFCIMGKNDNIVVIAKDISEIGISNKDSLHIASAVEALADYFITVDKGILKKRAQLGQVEICSPIEFITLLEANNNEC